MKMKKAILSCLMLLAGLTASAQEQKGTTEYVFEPHWYVQLQAGGQYTTGEAKFGDLISPNVQVGVGYQFSKALGARFAVNAWQGKAGYSKEATDKLGFGDLNYKFNYFAPSIDLTFDLSNIIAGFNPNRVVSFGAFIGGGVNFRSTSDEAEQTRNLIKFTSTDWTPMFENKSAVLPFAQAGLTVDFKVSDAVKLGAELNGNILGDKFNFKDAGNPDSYINLLVGAKIALGKTYSTKFIPAPEPEIKYVEKIVEKEGGVREVKVENLVFVTFAQGKSALTADAKKALDEIKEGKHVQIVGTASPEGSKELNDKLSQARADVVADYLRARGIVVDEATGKGVQGTTSNRLAVVYVK